MLLARRHADKRPGKVVAWVLLCATVIVGVLAINLDGGRIQEERRHAVTSADAASLAAASALYSNYWTAFGADPSGAAKAAAVQSAQKNGYPAGAVTVNIPPTSGTFAGVAGYVEVLLDTTLGATFGRIFTSADTPIHARSVSRGLPMKIGLIAMRSSGAGALTNNSLAFTLINSPLIVNSSDPSAFTQQSFGVFVATRADIVGGYVNSGGAIMLGRIRTGRRPVPDPLAFLPVPSDAGLPVISSSSKTINSILPTILQPGVYKGGLRITGVSIVTMLPGVYIMEGGGFVVDSLATVVGLGVMVYNTTGTSAAGPISVTSLGKVVMTAPLSGTYQGINFFQDRSLTNPVSMTGVGLAAITGVVYALKAPAQLTGLATVGLDVLGGAYVVDSMTVQGVGAINIDLKLNPPRIPDVRVVE